jgi:hypothetical protein
MTDELEAGPKEWRRSQNEYVGLSDPDLFKVCFRFSIEIERRLNNENYLPGHKLPAKTREERKDFARETAKLLMALAIRLHPRTTWKPASAARNNVNPLKPRQK